MLRVIEWFEMKVKNRVAVVVATWEKTLIVFINRKRVKNRILMN